MVARSIAATGGLLAALLGSPTFGVVLTLPATGYLTYGNTNSYSLPILAIQYDLMFGGGTGPGNPYYVNSTPGAIKDLVVIYTGASGVPVTTNADGFENAYQTPGGSPPNFANTVGAVNVVDPGSKAGIANPTANTWDATLLALKGFLDGGAPIFLFNNNDTNADQDLAIWAKLWITDGANAVYDNRFLYLSNTGALYGAGGVPNGDATTYNPGDVSPLVNAGTGATDYVRSGGEVCLSAALALQACDGTEAYKVNHNLGANQAAYAAVAPVLNTWLGALFALSDADLDDYTLHLQLALGCDPAWGGGNNCDSKKIDNGYEQLFLASTTIPVVNVPEPGSLPLLGLSLLALAAMLRRRRTPA
jgi:hypothetical protein